MNIASALLLLIANVILAIPTEEADQEYSCINSVDGNARYFGWQKGDGVCDCCDGSDEPEGVCPDICSMLMREATERRQAELAKVKIGRMKKLRLLSNSSSRAAMNREAEYRRILENLLYRNGDIKAAMREYAMLADGTLDCPLFGWFASAHLVRTITVTQLVEPTVAGKVIPEVWRQLPKCFKKQLGKYEYELCPFDRATQRDLESGAVVSLGLFKSYNASHMLFEQGQPCWRGPARSVAVALECGPDEDISMIDEPEACSYVMRLRNCAVC